jgi:hypothetical protein
MGLYLTVNVKLLPPIMVFPIGWAVIVNSLSPLISTIGEPVKFKIVLALEIFLIEKISVVEEPEVMVPKSKFPPLFIMLLPLSVISISGVGVTPFP